MRLVLVLALCVACIQVGQWTSSKWVNFEGRIIDEGVGRAHGVLLKGSVGAKIITVDLRPIQWSL